MGRGARARRVESRKVEESTVHFIDAIKTNIIPRRKKSERNAIDQTTAGVDTHTVSRERAPTHHGRLFFTRSGFLRTTGHLRELLPSALARSQRFSPRPTPSCFSVPRHSRKTTRPRCRWRRTFTFSAIAKQVPSFSDLSLDAGLHRSSSEQQNLVFLTRAIGKIRLFAELTPPTDEPTNDRVPNLLVLLERHRIGHDVPIQFRSRTRYRAPLQLLCRSSPTLRRFLFSFLLLYSCGVVLVPSMDRQRDCNDRRNRNLNRHRYRNDVRFCQ